MTTQSHNTPLARLSRIGLALGIGSTQATRNNNSKGEDESYIPYNGPYESPTGGHQIRGYWDNGVQDTTIAARSFSRFSSSEEKKHASYNQKSSFSNCRKYSDASRTTLPNIVTEPRRMFGRIRQNSTPPLRTPYLSLDKGGIGDTPVPAHRSTPSQSGSSLKVSSQPFAVLFHAYSQFQRRDSLFRASVTDLRKSFSRSEDRHEKTRKFGASPDFVPSAVSFPSVYEKGSRHSRSNSAVVAPRHPYATAFPQPGRSSPTPTNSQNQKRDYRANPPKKVPAHLKPSSRASLLKASVSTPDLRSASRQTGVYAKTKSHWLSAETWCDAFMFPRPRFLLRHLEEGSTTPKHRFVSPPESIVSDPTRPPGESKSLKRLLSASELPASKISKEVPAHVDRDSGPQPPSAVRPRSYALDDLALPSPIPSLATYVLTVEGGKSTWLTIRSVLADRQNLQNERQMWREHATKSLGNQRTRSLSRSRSLGKKRKPSYQHPPAGTLDFLVERTLLGHQAVPSVVHTTIDSTTIPTQTTSSGGQVTRSFSSTFPRLRSKSYGRSNSIGPIHDGPGHRRKESVSSVLRRAKSTATGLCVGADGISSPPDAVGVFVRNGDTKIVTISERPRRMTSPDSVVLISPAMERKRTSPDRISLVPFHQRSNVSPAPSGQSRSAEGVGIAISSPPPSEEHSDDEPFTFPAHPYARGANHHHRTPVNMTSQLSETTRRRQPIVHPYAIHSAHPATLPPQWVDRDRTISPAKRMFAEITPGRLREIRSEEIQYSPYIEDAPRVFTTGRVADQPIVGDRRPEDPASRRGSDILHMGDALSFSLARNRLSSSTDSGIGASEDPHPYGPQPERTTSSRSNTFPLDPVQELLLSMDDNGDEGTSHNEWFEPPSPLPHATSGNPDPTSPRTASSGQVNPSAFSVPLTPLRRMESSRSSPGLSNSSSPPLTPGTLGKLDDLERFQDLFYNPTVHRPRSPEMPTTTVLSTELEDLRLTTSPANLARSRSQLTTLVRQLSQDLHELRNEELAENNGRLVGANDEQWRNLVISAGPPSSSGSSRPALGPIHPFLSTLSTQQPFDQPVSSSRQNFPEDVESELSSLFDRIPEEHYDETMGSHSHHSNGLNLTCLSVKKSYVSAMLKRFPLRLPSIAHVPYRVCLVDWTATSSLTDACT